MLTNKSLSKKRYRQEAEQHAMGFGERRMKRQNSAYVQQKSPILNLHSLSSYATNLNCPSSCAISLTSGESDVMSSYAQSAICVPPQLSPQSTISLLHSSPIISPLDNEETSHSLYMTQDSESEIYDTIYLSPGSIYNEISISTCNRIPTPIYSSFNLFEKADISNIKTIDVSGERLIKRANRATILHSPIKEEHMSPSIIVAGLNEMQVSEEKLIQLKEREKETKSTSLQSKSDLDTSMCASEGQNSENIKKIFCMGYRSNCEKCKMKVPGHFSHVILSKCDQKESLLSA
ncbi:hypothetical protein EV44_g2775 [Erysiphe necator]|uniref:Uncharacterized protein n=1 Tax=Uncinula necator TaxID=52586 RepID=A0A0B1PGE7_UNCNE|nr:hypothetical protein EV44_g2775 [Erysiphe necator]